MFNWPNDLVSDIARRTCVLYIGAGVSANSSSAKGISPPTWEAFLRSCLTKINKADCAFSSTRYRYPYKGSKDKPIKQIPLEPVAISITDLVPDLSEGIPWIAIRANQVGVASKGSKLLCEMKDLFDIIETLFKFSEETDM